MATASLQGADTGLIVTRLEPLDFQLDYSCPIALPSKSIGAIWPWKIA